MMPSDIWYSFSVFSDKNAFTCQKIVCFVFSEVTARATTQAVYFPRNIANKFIKHRFYP
jgi:hypothetical protein